MAITTAMAPAALPVPVRVRNSAFTTCLIGHRQRGGVAAIIAPMTMTRPFGIRQIVSDRWRAG